MEGHYTEPISLKYVAATVNLSPGYLTTAIRECTTALWWISEPRMAEARRLLVETDESVEGIGAQIEYDDPRYFARRFQISHGRPLPHGAAPTRLCRLLVARKYALCAC